MSWSSGNTRVDKAAGGEFFPQFFAGQSQAALGGGQVRLHRFGHFGQTQSGIDVQDERQPLIVGNVGQQIVHRAGEFALVQLLGGERKLRILRWGASYYFQFIRDFLFWRGRASR